jgi:hypothetical protein
MGACRMPLLRSDSTSAATAREDDAGTEALLVVQTRRQRVIGKGHEVHMQAAPLKMLPLRHREYES